MDLIKKSYYYASNTKFFNLFILTIFINDIVFPIVTSQLMYNLSKGDVDVIIWILALKIIYPLVDNLTVAYLLQEVHLEVNIKVLNDSLKKYVSLSFISKNKYNSPNHYEKMISANSAIRSMIDWGMPTMITLIGTFVGCLWTFILMDLVTEMFIATSISLLVYYFVIRKRQNTFTKKHKKVTKKNSKLRSKISISLRRLQYKEITPDAVSKLSNEIEKNYVESNHEWRKIATLTNILNQIGVIIVALMMKSNITGFMLIIMSLGNLSSAVSQLTHFINQFNRYVNDFTVYEESWKDLEFKNDPQKLNLPSKLNILDINLQKGDFCLKLDGSLKNNFSIGPGCKILVRGKTGKGKSTFLEGLTGKIDGVRLNYGNPDNFYWLVADMYQNIREQNPTSGITVRDLFNADDHQDDELIMHCMSLCFEPEELTSLLNALLNLKTKSSNEDDIEESKVTSPFDVDIQEILSGGQKSRLCLATRVYEMKKKNKQILIMDEPEQGSDPETAVWVLQNIFRDFADKTIIMTSHMCKCRLDNLNVQWTYQLEIGDGLIKNKI